MNYRPHRRIAALLALSVLPNALAAQGTPVGFPEAYALAENRPEVVATLIPGTEEWYYYTCRELLAARDFAAVRQQLGPWIQRHGRTQRVREIEDREALLSFDADPERTFRHLRDRLGLSWNHQRSVPGEESDLPTELDRARLSPTNLTRQALQRHPGTVDGFENRALAALLTTDLGPDQLHSLLGRLQRPDVDNLPALVVRDLQHQQSRGFGSLTIHNLLRLSQLEECARLQPALLNEPAFVEAYVPRLAPRADIAWQRDPAARSNQLARLWQFAQRLAPAHNSLKAHILFHWLAHDLTQGNVDKGRFLTYIRLPRRLGYVARTYIERPRPAQDLIQYGRAFATGLPPVNDDEALVRACLEHFFASEDGYGAYAEYLDENWLKQILAETKIVLGQGDMERWYSMLDDPRRLAEIEQRIEIAFPPTQPTTYGAGDPVSIAVDTKNVPTLLVKVFVIDSYRYLVEQGKDVDATIELDGLVANQEQTYQYDEPPLRRVRRRFDLPMLSQPGTYVVELVGNGISSRAVIHKGSLRHVERTSAAGHLFRVYDETGTQQKTAMLWFGGKEYEANDNGDILLPFSTDPGRKRAVLRLGNRAELITFVHRSETFELSGSAFVERESLIAGQTARLALRPQLRIDGHPVALKLLSDPVLTVTAIDIDGTRRSNEVRGLALVDGREFVHEITVPERLQSLEVSLRGRARDLNGKDVQLATATTSFAVNGIDTTAETLAAMLVPNAAGYAIEIRGKNGELIIGRPCNLQIKHRDFREPIDVALQTGSDGRIALGPLPGVERVAVSVNGASNGVFALPDSRMNLPSSLQGRAGETLRLPYQGRARSVSRQEFSLLANDEDAFASLALADGFLELRNLPAGDYVLQLHETGRQTVVRITAGNRSGDWIVGQNRILEASTGDPLHVRSIDVAGDQLRIAVTNFTAQTRVHVITTRFVPTFDPFTHLNSDAPTQLSSYYGEAATSSYHAGRKLGDEYRYVLERRFATKFAGNMLQRPSLLLNPWDLERNSWNSAVGLGGGAGGRFGGRGGRGASRAGGKAGRPEGSFGPGPGTFANLDWLPTAASATFNLTPGDNGVVEVPTASLGQGQVVHVLAIDGDEAIYDRLLLDERPLQPQSRALTDALPADDHFVQQKRIEFVAAGGEAVIGDARSADVEVFDSLAGVFQLMATISRNSWFAQFAFVLEWPGFDDARKRQLYSEHACHELHFFLYQKDRPFFDAVVRPFLASKRNQTFLDEWLLGQDLRHHLEPWAFARLNLIEKILLAQRLDGAERQAVARLIAEQFELRPIDRDYLDRLFDTALAANELENNAESVVGLLSLSLDEKARGPGDAVPPSPETSAPIPSAGGPVTDGPGGPTTPGPENKPRRRAQAQDKQEAEPAEAPAAAADDFFLGKRKNAGEPLLEQLEQEVLERGRAGRLYRAVQPTRLLVESNYWRLPLEETTPDLVAPNQFWVDYAAASSGEPFVSPAFIQAGGSFLEMMFALSVLDLPFEAGKHEVVADGGSRRLRAASPLLLVRKEVTRTTPAEDEPPLLLGENLFRLDERYQYEGGVQREKFVTDEFLTSVAYGAQVVISNPTGQRRTIDVLLQLPAGALPVQRGFWTRSVPIELSPYETKSVEYAFYFPATGAFSHYPAHAASQGRLVASTDPRTLTVVATPSRVDTRSWEHVSQQGSSAEVMAYLDSHNVQRLDLSKIAWRLADREFFTALIQRLSSRHVYDHLLWSYGLLHRDVESTREYLKHADDFLRGCGAALTSTLVTIDPVERGAYQHLELDPLVHARAHRLGSQHVIGNADLARQYGQLLDVLGYHARLSSDDWLAVTYYLLLQDRVEEALASYARIVPAELTARIQYDYLAAYLCFFTGDTQRARRVAEGYREYPVEHWQKRFGTVLAYLDEAEGKTTPNTGATTADIAAAAPAIELFLEGRTARLAHKNLERCEVRYYELDVEFAFSAQPFASTGGTAAAYVQPNLREVRELPAGADGLVFELPPQFHTKNVLVEVRAGGLVRSRTYFANTLDVRFLESFGQVSVTDPTAQRPLPKTYVKVFARLPNGQIRFHKDGYTDLRGRFDYASLSDDPNAGADRYAVLVLSEQFGAVIRDVAPPVQ